MCMPFEISSSFFVLVYFFLKMLQGYWALEREWKDYAKLP